MAPESPTQLITNKLGDLLSRQRDNPSHKRVNIKVSAPDHSDAHNTILRREKPGAPLYDPLPGTVIRITLVGNLGEALHDKIRALYDQFSANQPRVTIEKSVFPRIEKEGDNYTLKLTVSPEDVLAGLDKSALAANVEAPAVAPIKPKKAPKAVAPPKDEGIGDAARAALENMAKHGVARDNILGNLRAKMAERAEKAKSERRAHKQARHPVSIAAIRKQNARILAQREREEAEKAAAQAEKDRARAARMQEEKLSHDQQILLTQAGELRVEMAKLDQKDKTYEEGTPAHETITRARQMLEDIHALKTSDAPINAWAEPLSHWQQELPELLAGVKALARASQPDIPAPKLTEELYEERLIAERRRLTDRVEKRSFRQMSIKERRAELLSARDALVNELGEKEETRIHELYDDYFGIINAQERREAKLTALRNGEARKQTPGQPGRPRSKNLEKLFQTIETVAKGEASDQPRRR